MRRLVLFLASVLAAATCAAQVSSLPGRQISSDELARRAVAVGPEGRGLPPGSGSVAEGRRLYLVKCALCHGPSGEGSAIYPQLVGGIGTLASAQPIQTIGSFWPYATTVWDYIDRAMPYQAPGTLTADEVYAVLAYLLHLNGIVGPAARLDARSVPQVRMPNRDGFIDDPRPDIR